MLYPKTKERTLSAALFRNPGSEYRGTPFWSWNGALERDEMLRQIELFERMGFGGFHMHVRTGLQVPYLSDDFMDLIQFGVGEAKKRRMLAWLYDEDRWPSGSAGGLVTRDPRFRARYLLFTTDPYAGGVSAGGRRGNGDLIACYDIGLDRQGFLASFRRIGEHEPASAVKWYAYVETPKESGWQNRQTYVNTLDPDAIDRFIEITHERYRQKVGGEFGKSVPAIFTDEPQFTRKQTLAFADEQTDVILPWTDDLPRTFFEECGEDLLEHLPELFWELPGGRRSVARYHYHDHLTERFTRAFCDNIGRWCEKNGILFTGHMMDEPALQTQTRAIGEAMRAYRSFTLPGIDMLCSRKEYTTAKQAQSAARQYRREGVLSELYGVSGWDFDFRGHKLNGDWQAALGVTVRVLHLAWYTMKGEAKRDYPPSIGVQSSWAEEYRQIEDHFARVNTAMTRGRPVVRIGVIHPIESYWLHWGPSEQTAAVRGQMDENFLNLASWLLLGLQDFDYISESLLPGQCAQGGNPLSVGAMSYDVVLVPECETLRSTTLERLEQFRSAGGRLIFLGRPPALENARPSDRGLRLYRNSETLGFSRSVLLDALEDVREVDIRTGDGQRADHLLYQLREDDSCRWLFIAHGTDPDRPDSARSQRLRITMRGEFRPELYDTQTGEIKPVDYRSEDERTVIWVSLYDYDSLLFRLEAGKGRVTLPEGREPCRIDSIPVPKTVAYSLQEPNVLLLDTAEVSVDGGDFEPEEELLRAFVSCCGKLGLDWETAHTVQPWVYGKEKPEHHAVLRFTVSSEQTVRDAQFAFENAALSQLWVNGTAAPMEISGWFTDRAIQTVRLPELREGTNFIEARVPIGSCTGLEWCYLLGNFGVRLNGREKTLIPIPEKIGFDSIVMQNLPFYGANVTYRIPFQSHGGRLRVAVPHYRGALVGVRLDGRRRGSVIYPPYRLELCDVPAGAHELSLTLLGTRRNCFGALHNADESNRWETPRSWSTTGDAWTYEYRLRPMGIISSPILEEVFDV